MWRHQLTIALRALRRDRGYALLNGIGLAIALACCLLVGLFARAEGEVDAYHPDVDRLRAVWADLHWGPESRPDLTTPEPLAEALAEHTAVGAATSVWSVGLQAVRVDGREGVQEANLRVASEGWFDVFQPGLRRGDPDRLLREPGVVLREQAARDLFGPGDPVGRTLTLETWRDTLEVAVTGVIADPPGRTVVLDGLDGLISPASLPADRQPSWFSASAGTFVRLAPGATDADLDSAWADIVATHYSESDDPPAFGAVPLASLHLSELSRADGFRGSLASLRLLGLVAAFVLLLGVINYVNLATARAARRAREVGVRHAVGSGRARLAGQFLAEAVVLAVGSGIAALGLAVVLRPGFNALFGADLAAGDLDLPFVLSALALAAATGLLAGLYPAAVLSGIRPVAALRGTLTGGRPTRGRLRQGLVVVQLVVAVGLLAGTGAVLRQIAFARASDPGYDADRLVAVDLEDARLGAQWQSALDAVRARPEVEAAAATNAYPTRTGSFYTAPIGGARPVEAASFRVLDGEPDYLEVLGARVVAGRLPDSRSSDRDRAVVLNETAVRELGWGRPRDVVGTTFEFNQSELVVVGVVADQHVVSFREPIDAMMVTAGDPFSGGFSSGYSTILLRLGPGGLGDGLAAIRDALASLDPTAHPEIVFLDERVAALYDDERRLGRVLAAFAGVAILIACLGLFGLAAYTAERRTKEIGVRRVLGATVAQIVALLTREIVALVALASILAVPAAAWVMHRWLEGFAYRASLPPGLFALAVALALAFALLAVGGQALRAASRTPASTLRTD